MVEAAKHSRALHRPQVADILDNTDRLPVALRVAAQRTDIARIEIAAFGTVADGAGNLAEILGQRQHEPLAVLQKVKHRATGRTRPKPGKTCHPPDQIVELRIHDRAGLRREATCRAVAEGRR